MLEYTNTEPIHLKFFNKWISVDPRTILIDDFKFQNVPSDTLVAYSIKDENANKGIALLSGKIVKEVNNGTLWSDKKDQNVPTFSTFDRSLGIRGSRFSPGTEEFFSKGLKNILRKRGLFLKNECSDSGVCLAFGKETKRIKRHFNDFVDLKYAISPVKSFGSASNNGFVNQIKYERDGYKAKAILKSTTKQDSDNLLFEYLVGQYINKQCLVFPCFIETYGWYIYNTDTDWDFMSKKSGKTTIEILKSSLEIGQVALQKYVETQVSTGGNFCVNDKHKLPPVERDCTEIESLFKFACENSQYLAILTQHINNAKSLHSMIISSTDVDFPYHDLLNVLYQIYMPLSTLAETFTHYDFHLLNTLIYEPVVGKYIDYKYKFIDKTIPPVKFKCRYMAKIIDYGRSFFNDTSNKEITGNSNSIYETICENIRECNGGGKNGLPLNYCGEDQGFSNFDTSKYGIGHYIDSSFRNITHDLLLLYRVKKLLKRPSLSHKLSNPLLQTIFDRSKYANELLSEAEELKTGVVRYEYGSPELYDTNPLIDGMPEKIDNVIDAHNALKTQVIKNKTDNASYYQTMTSLGKLKIYESGKPMKFKPK